MGTVADGIDKVSETSKDDKIDEASSGMTREVKNFMKARANVFVALKVQSIMLQSPLLKKVLIKVFDDFPGMMTELELLGAQGSVSFSAPFEPFVHRWSEFKNQVDEEADSETKEHLLLYQT